MRREAARLTRHAPPILRVPLGEHVAERVDGGERAHALVVLPCANGGRAGRSLEYTRAVHSSAAERADVLRAVWKQQGAVAMRRAPVGRDDANVERAAATERHDAAWWRAL